MATLMKQTLGNSPTYSSSRVPESWGLLLIPVLLCIGMLIFATATKTAPAPAEVPVSRTCVASDNPVPSDAC